MEIFLMDDDNDAIRNLVTKIGEQALLHFMAYLNENKENSGTNIPSPETNIPVKSNNDAENRENLIDINTCDISKNANLSEYIIINPDETIQTISTPIDSEITSFCLLPSTSEQSSSNTPVNLKRHFGNSITDLNLKSILQSHCYGEAILAIYHKKIYWSLGTKITLLIL